MAVIKLSDVQQLVDALLLSGVTEIAEVPAKGFEIIDQFATQFGQYAALVKQRQDEAKGSGEAAYYTLYTLRPILFWLDPADPAIAPIEALMTDFASRWPTLPQKLEPLEPTQETTP